jgi:hypothetical protein
MRGSIAGVVVCLVLGAAASAAAQETSGPDDGAPASVEMSLSVAPVGLLSITALNFGGTGTPGLGGLGMLQPTLDVAFALDRSLLFAVGLGVSASSSPSGDDVSVSLPLSLLWYLEPPRVGRVMPMLRIGVDLGYANWTAVTTLESYRLGALARGGITWLADRCIGIRAELGLRGGAWVSDSEDVVAASVGLDALVGVVLRL